MSDAAAFRSTEIAAILTLGVIGVLIAGLQPQLLGALAGEGRLSTAQLGVAATGELLAMGIAAGGAGVVVPRDRLRPACLVAGLVLALLDLATIRAAGGATILLRALAGLAEGVLIWLAIGFIARAANPARWAALYLMAQTLAQLVIAAALAGAILPRWGSSGGFVVLASITLAAVSAVAAMPRAYPALAGSGLPDDVPGRMPGSGFVALGGVLLYLAFVVSLWVYIEPLAREAGLPNTVIAAAVPVSLAMQVAGAGAAAWFANRLPAGTVIAIAIACDLAILAVLGAAPLSAPFLATIALFGFLWLFVLPFQVPLVIAADPSRRAALLIGGAQLIGSGLGPLAASGLVGAGDVRPVLWLGGGCVLASGVAMLLSTSKQKRLGVR